MYSLNKVIHYQGIKKGNFAFSNSSISNVWLSTNWIEFSNLKQGKWYNIINGVIYGFKEGEGFYGDVSGVRFSYKSRGIVAIPIGVVRYYYNYSPYLSNLFNKVYIVNSASHPIHITYLTYFNVVRNFTVSLSLNFNSGSMFNVDRFFTSSKNLYLSCLTTLCKIVSSWYNTWSNYTTWFRVEC